MVTLKGICVIGDDGGRSPKTVKLFRNREDIDFDNVEDIDHTQKIALPENFDGEATVLLKPFKFNNVTSLTMYIQDNYGADTTKIYYIGLKGERTGNNNRDKIVITNYELRPNAAYKQQNNDHLFSSKSIQ
eukprot:TRINITY_DN5603_c2_g2_i1.p1 TRINITY_DN5603_c2_g2~~TRINITY_DN5603_c2_g2_i1.p1  ORF type:complete len:131 (+),score=26.00 TRINITY_DN5603_c2_g2_i1:277-669(+)